MVKRTSVSMEPGRRPDIEKEFDEKYAVKWTFTQNVSTSRFDVEASQANQARFEAIDQATVDQYTDAVSRGDAFPAVIAWRPGDGRYLIVIDGNHRLLAHIAAGKAIDVYEVHPDTNPMAITLMTYSFNTRHGRPTTEAERLEQALFLIDNGASVKQAAAEVNISEAQVKKARKGRLAQRRADEVGLRRNEWESIAATGRDRLTSITTDEGFRAAAELAFVARLSVEEIGALVSDLSASNSAQRQSALVANLRAEYAERIQSSAGGALTSANRRGLTPKGRVSGALGTILSTLEDESTFVSMFSQPERPEAARKMWDASERLSKLATQLDPNIAARP